MQQRPSFTIENWCNTRGLSRSMFYKMQKAGKGPRLHYAGNKPLVSPEADDEWLREREREAAKAFKNGEGSWSVAAAGEAS
jgi:hypothetical protein